MIKPSSLNIELPTFRGSFDCIHIDEKWFYLIEESNSFYLVPNEEPQFIAKSKHFVLEVMFFTAVACPHFDYLKNQYFNYKIGICPLVFEGLAKQSYKNCLVSTMEIKPLQ